MKIAYIAHPIGALKNSQHPQAEVLVNLNKIQGIAREINLSEPGTVLFAPYYLDCVCMNDNDLEERERGIKNDMALLQSGIVTELRLYGPRISWGDDN